MKERPLYTEDPTENVKALMQASLSALAEIRVSDQKFLANEIAHVEEMAKERAGYFKELRSNDVERYAAIRQVDITNAAAAAAQIQTAIQALAKTTEDTRKTLADAMANKDARTDERLGALERTASLGEGKQRISDPMLSQLVDEVKKLSTAGVTGQGASKGMRDMWGWVIGAIIVAIAIAGLFWRH